MLSQPNATITIGTLTPEPIAWDDVTGQPIFGEPTLTQVFCFLEQTKDPQEKNLPGVDNPIAYLEGRVEGQPTGLKIKQFYPITIQLQTESYNARFYLMATNQGGFGLEAYFGTAIAGYLVE